MNTEFLLIVFTIFLILALYTVWEYNGLISYRGRIDNAWNHLEELLRSRRSILQRFLNENIQVPTELKTALQQSIQDATVANTVSETLVIEKRITQQLSEIFETAEFFADSNYGNALRTLHTIDQRFTLAQMLYNDIVLQYHHKLESFPTNMIASVFNFATEPLSE